jgi:carbon storage regulator
MLVLSRKVGQKILIGDRIAVTVVRVAQGTVRIGVEAPEEFSIVREEIRVESGDTSSESLSACPGEGQ